MVMEQRVTDRLSGADRKEFRRCESIIKRGVRTFIDVGNALKVIQENQYYREKYQTFEQYCKERWEFSRAHAYRLIESAKVVETLSGSGDLEDESLPGRESQVRELSKIQDETARQIVWEKAVSAATESNDGKITAKIIASEVKSYIEEHPEVEVKQSASTQRSVIANSDGGEDKRSVPTGLGVEFHNSLNLISSETDPSDEMVTPKLQLIQPETAGGLASWAWHPITAKPRPEFHLRQLHAPKYTSPVSNSKDPEDATVIVTPGIDLFGAGIQPKWIDDISAAAEETSEKWTFITITSEYAKAAAANLPSNLWIGAQIDSTEDLIRAEKAFAGTTTTVFIYCQTLTKELTLAAPSPFSWIVICGSNPQPSWKNVWNLTYQAYDFNIPVFWNTDLHVRASERPILG